MKDNYTIKFVNTNTVNTSSFAKASYYSNCKATGYFINASEEDLAMEGGNLDRFGHSLIGHTLQDAINGSNAYVACAMDIDSKLQGKHIRIPEIESKVGKYIDFYISDCGDHFNHKTKESAIDICCIDKHSSLMDLVNESVTLLYIDCINPKG